MPSIEIFSSTWIVIFCVVFLAALIRGLSGFGFALVLAPILLLIIDPKEMVVINLFLGFLGQLLVLCRSYKMVDLKRIFPMMASTLLGIPLGAWIINVVAPSGLKITIGFITLCFAIPIALGYHKSFGNERLSSSMAGFFSGILTSSTSLGGPPIVLFMHNQHWPKERIYPSLAAQFMVGIVSSLIALTIAGNVKMELFVAAASFSPAMFIGIYSGMYFFHRTPTRLFTGISMIIVMCTAILGIISGLGIFP